MGDVPWISQSHHCPLHNLLTLALRELALSSIVIAPSSNNIEQEVLLLLADEYRPTCPSSMTNPGSLTMGFVGADPLRCRLWELHRLESQSRRSRLQQATIQEQEPDLTHSKNSSLLQASPSPHQDCLIRSRVRPSITAIAKFIADKKYLD